MMTPSSTKNYSLIGVACGWGATNTGTYLGPKKIMTSHDPFEITPPKIPSRNFMNYFNKSQFIESEITPLQDLFPLSGSDLDVRTTQCAKIYRELYKTVTDTLEANTYPFVIGGDQSISLGTWSSVLDYTHKQDENKPLGLIWIDAHLDAHTPLTSPSNAPHGMPAATLMGYGESKNNHTPLQPDRLVYIASRSYEEGEHELLKSLGVKIYYQTDVDQRGFTEIFKEAKAYVSRGNCPFGITLDIDAFDPSEAPGTGASASHGLKSRDVLPALTGILDNQNLIAFELVEFNPKLDYEDKTLNLIWQIFHQMKNECKNSTFKSPPDSIPKQENS